MERVRNWLETWMAAPLGKKPVVDECVLHGPRIIRNKDGRVKLNGNLNLYMEEEIQKLAELWESRVR